MSVDKTKLMNIEDVGDERADRLLKKFGDYESVRNASQFELREIDSIGIILSRRISVSQSSLTQFEK